MAERIRFRVDEDVAIVTTSIGISLTLFPVKCTQKNVDWFIDDLIVRADRALYRAKTTGRNQVFSA